MIISGTKGCLCIYWNDLLIAGFPLSKRNPYDRYKLSAEDLILDALRKGRNMKDLIHQFTSICHMTYMKKKDKKKISSFDLQVCCHCILALIRLQIHDEDDLVLIAPKRKSVKRNNKLALLNN